MSGSVTRLTPDVHACIVTSLRAGNFVTTATAAAGVGRSTYYDWRRRGRVGEEPFASFVRDVDIAGAEAEVAAVAAIRNAAGDDWRAAAWFLERRAPERYGARLDVVIERACEERERELGERVLARLPDVLPTFGVAVERAADFLHALIDRLDATPAHEVGVSAPDGR